MSEHTKGPWKVCPAQASKCPCRMIWTDDVCVAVAHGKHWKEAIGDPWPNDDIADANAEFIVLACNAHDDLLAACEECLAACNRWDFSTSPAAIGICISKLEAAIAKAKGTE